VYGNGSGNSNDVNHMSPLTNESSAHPSPSSSSSSPPKKGLGLGGSPSPSPIKGDLMTIKKRILELNNINTNTNTNMGIGMGIGLQGPSSSSSSYNDDGLGLGMEDFNDIDTAEIDRHAVMTKEYLDSKNAVSGADLTEEELELRR